VKDLNCNTRILKTQRKWAETKFLANNRFYGISSGKIFYSIALILKSLLLTYFNTKKNVSKFIFTIILSMI